MGTTGAPERGGLSEELARDVAMAVLPELAGTDVTVETGSEHLVVVAPGTGVVRVAKTARSALLMARGTELLLALSQLGLPFAVPEPLSDVVTVDGLMAVATSWVPGQPHPKGQGGPAVLRWVLDALAGVGTGALAPLLAEPHAYPGGQRWGELMVQAIGCLPSDVQDDALWRLEQALALPTVQASLVHGDLGGHNMRWSTDGRLVGVIDWDWAAAWDPAVDAACLAWHGWPAVAAAVDASTYQRARTWYRTFGIEQVVAGWLRPPGPPDVVERAAEWLRRTRDQP